MYRRVIRIEGKLKKYSHYIWHQNTGHWPIGDEVIHHIDDDTSNDVFENLQLLSRAEHSSLHSRGRPISEKQKAQHSVLMMGENNPNWQGDAASDNAKYQRIRSARRRAKK